MESGFESNSIDVALFVISITLLLAEGVEFFVESSISYRGAKRFDTVLRLRAIISCTGIKRS